MRLKAMPALRGILHEIVPDSFGLLLGHTRPSRRRLCACHPWWWWKYQSCAGPGYYSHANLGGLSARRRFLLGWLARP